MEPGDDGRRPFNLYLLPFIGGRIGNIQTEVIDIEIVLVGAVEVADSDVALRFCILAQIDGVFHVFVGDDGLGQYDVGEVSHCVSCGGDIDGNMLLEIVGILSFHPHLQHTIEWQQWRHEPVVGGKNTNIIVIACRTHISLPVVGKFL